MIIAIVDDAIDLDHEDLAANIFINWAEYNGTAGLDDDLTAMWMTLMAGILQNMIMILIQ